MFGNWLKTSVLMAGIVALFGVIGGVLGGQQGMLIALVFGGATNLWAYWFSDKAVLKMYRARPVDAATSPYLYNIVRDLSQRAGLPMPKVYII
ncbi:MAG: protease HtpX, partial [Azoarcus sp.]|nr:protease HtpX [Azoarcus sp.]